MSKFRSSLKNPQAGKIIQSFGVTHGHSCLVALTTYQLTKQGGWVPQTGWCLFTNTAYLKHYSLSQRHIGLGHPRNKWTIIITTRKTADMQHSHTRAKKQKLVSYRIPTVSHLNGACVKTLWRASAHTNGVNALEMQRWTDRIRYYGADRLTQSPGLCFDGPTHAHTGFSFVKMHFWVRVAGWGLQFCSHSIPRNA